MRNKFLTILACTAILTGCSDAYEIEQPGYVTEENLVFSTADDINRGIQGLYATLPGESEINFTSYFTDELGVGIGNTGQGINDGSYTFVLQAGNSFANSIWTNYYNVINRINRMDNRAQELISAGNQSEAELAKLEQSRSRLLALRAYCHYKLFAYFTPNYNDPNGLSIIKFDFLQTEDYSRFEKRATVAEIVEFIEQDIADSKSLGGPGIEDTGYINNWALEAILIKLYSMVQTPEAYAKLGEAFTRLTTGESPKTIGDFGEFAGMFSGSSVNGNEAIFRLIRKSSEGNTQSGVASAWYSNGLTSSSNIVYMEMGRSLYNELDKLDPSKQGEVRTGNDRSDIRYNLNVYDESKVATNYQNLPLDQYYNNDVLLIGKYTGITNRPNMNDIWLFRTTDLYLAYAEKLAHDGLTTGTVAIGNYDNVESIIYNIRANRNAFGTMEPASMPSDFSTKQAAYARILEERRIEFAFEGHRYLDVKRLGKLANQGFVRDYMDCQSTGACELEPTSFKLTLPIPRSEVISNPNIIQNDGY